MSINVARLLLRERPFPIYIGKPSHILLIYPHSDTYHNIPHCK